MKKKIELPPDWKDRPALSVAETAEIFRCTAAHIFNQISRDAIPAIKTGRRLAVPGWWVRQQIGDPTERK